MVVGEFVGQLVLGCFGAARWLQFKGGCDLMGLEDAHSFLHYVVLCACDVCTGAVFHVPSGRLHVGGRCMSGDFVLSSQQVYVCVCLHIVGKSCAFNL